MDSNDSVPYDEAKLVARPEMIEAATELRDFVEGYEPANSHATLEEQLFLAKAHKCDTIEAKDIVFKAVFGEVPRTCYAMIKGIKVYREGMVAEGRRLDARSADSMLFQGLK